MSIMTKVYIINITYLKKENVVNYYKNYKLLVLEIKCKHSVSRLLKNKIYEYLHKKVSCKIEIF